MKLGFKELGIQPTCNKCGEIISQVNDLSIGINNYDVSHNKHHVCDPEKVKQQKLELKEVIKLARIEQHKILAMKNINMDQLNKPMDI